MIAFNNIYNEMGILENVLSFGKILEINLKDSLV